MLNGLRLLHSNSSGRTVERSFESTLEKEAASKKIRTEAKDVFLSKIGAIHHRCTNSPQT